MQPRKKIDHKYNNKFLGYNVIHFCNSVYLPAMQQIIRKYSLLHWRQPMLSCNLQTKMLNKFDNFLILDFESTCEKNVKINKQEIIEFPCIWVDSNLNIISIFHRYVKPVHNPILTQYCTNLTGILQEMVQNEETFDKVLPSFMSWQESVHQSVGESQSKVFVTSGDWDLKVMLPSQCQLNGHPVPLNMPEWLNLKAVFQEATGYYPKSLKDMCKHLGLSFIGRQHSGIDDCRNILNIMRNLKLKYYNLFQS